jgi:superfamily II DNA or RNA helicase
MPPASPLSSTTTSPSKSASSATPKTAPKSQAIQVLEQLAKIDVEKLRDATEQTIRVETRRKFGHSNIASIHHSSEQQLERTPGITGSTSSQERQNLVDQFQNSPQPKALAGLIQAAGTGLNIQAASVIILCELQIKPSLETQAIARAHRMCQVRTVQVHRLIVPESVDEQMLAVLARKQAEFNEYARESALADGATSANEIGEESIAKMIVLEERKRLGITSQDEVKIGDIEL